MPHAVPAVPGGRPIALWTVERDDYRRTIPSNVRVFVFDRDGDRCVLCGAIQDLTLDHIFPWSLGGEDTVENLRVLCRSCNSRKGARV
ncbi:HNH endonuclease [Nonomuraea maritima]|uniref:HNH endonuclease n=2 Tax=Nonomuraea maritima TaxID=683260 RepID=A0A1G9MJ45_9ACTN|nr:HNH endonuclease [Nonomuraea maritima]